MGYAAAYGSIGFGSTAMLLHSAHNSPNTVVRVYNSTGATMFVGANSSVVSTTGFPIADGSATEFNAGSDLYVVGTANGTARYFRERK